MPELLSILIDELVNPTLLLMMSLAVLYFLWGVAKFVMNLDSEIERDNGKRHMFWGVIGLTIMLSVWGIIRFLMSVASSLN